MRGIVAANQMQRDSPCIRLAMAGLAIPDGQTVACAGEHSRERGAAKSGERLDLGETETVGRTVGRDDKDCV